MEFLPLSFISSLHLFPGCLSGRAPSSGPSCGFNLQAFALQLRLIEVLAAFFPYCGVAACLEGVFFSLLSLVVRHRPSCLK